MSYNAPATSLVPNQKPEKKREVTNGVRERERGKNQRELFQWLLKKNEENNCLFTNSHWMTS